MIQWLVGEVGIVLGYAFQVPGQSRALAWRPWSHPHAGVYLIACPLCVSKQPASRQHPGTTFPHNSKAPGGGWIWAVKLTSSIPPPSWMLPGCWAAMRKKRGNLLGLSLDLNCCPPAHPPSLCPLPNCLRYSWCLGFPPELEHLVLLLGGTNQQHPVFLLEGGG